MRRRTAEREKEGPMSFPFAGSPPSWLQPLIRLCANVRAEPVTLVTRSCLARIRFQTTLHRDVGRIGCLVLWSAVVILYTTPGNEARPPEPCQPQGAAPPGTTVCPAECSRSDDFDSLGGTRLRALGASEIIDGAARPIRRPTQGNLGCRDGRTAMWWWIVPVRDVERGLVATARDLRRLEQDGRSQYRARLGRP
jgi:hypothetical protein